MRCWTHLFCSLFLFLITSPSLANEQKWLNEAFVKNAFLQVTLQSEYRKGQFPLSKWQKPIKYWFDHDVADEAFHEMLTESQFEQLRKLTHLDISPASSQDEANFSIHFTRQSHWKSLVARTMGNRLAHVSDGALCLFGLSINQDNYDINTAVIVIPVDTAREHGKLLSCIIEETTQALGLINDSEQVYPSIFNDKTPNNFLSPLDVILVKLMYEPAIKSGMTEESLSALLTELISEYKRYGVLDNAVHTAKEAPLVREYGY